MEGPTQRTTNRKRNRLAQPKREMSGEQRVTRPAKGAAWKNSHSNRTGETAGGAS